MLVAHVARGVCRGQSGGHYAWRGGRAIVGGSLGMIGARHRAMAP